MTIIKLSTDCLSRDNSVGGTDTLLFPSRQVVALAMTREPNRKGYFKGTLLEKIEHVNECCGKQDFTLNAGEEFYANTCWSI
jgi:hypothetical protein